GLEPVAHVARQLQQRLVARVLLHVAKDALASGVVLVVGVLLGAKGGEILFGVFEVFFDQVDDAIHRGAGLVVLRPRDDLPRPRRRDGIYFVAGVGVVAAVAVTAIAVAAGRRGDRAGRRIR